MRERKAMTDGAASADLRHVLAPNPSPMTFRGTNTWIVGRGTVAVIDPGPDDATHLAAILGALTPDERISHIFVTHAHLDHSALAPALAAQAGAPVLAFGTVRDGLRPGSTATGSGEAEGLDHAFVPDRRLADGDRIEGPGWSLQAIHTPGHLGNHLCLGWGTRCFTGDHVMGWSSSIVSPPEGDMGAYMASLAKLAAQPWDAFLPGHGDPIRDPAARLDALRLHRLGREADILRAIDSGLTSPRAITSAVYADTPSTLIAAAARNVLAHLIDLVERNILVADPSAKSDAQFHRR
jgi:glyoxylase-like metal-dependent hydrolase (beta-lactamase superfamily II)